MMITITVQINDRGLRIGQDHPRTVLTDAEVLRLLSLHRQGIGQKRLSKMFEVPRRTVRDYISGRTRGQLPSGFREVQA